MEAAWPWRQAVVDLLEQTRLAQPDELAAAVTRAALRLRLDLTIYLVDQEQRELWRHRGARDRSGSPFGEQRLIHLVKRHSGIGLPPPETLRRLSHAALDH